jgi:methyl-CpG-binding domain protein 4
MKTPLETSPYSLFQEEFRVEPWKLLTCCVLVNCATAKVARPVWEKIFRRWPTPWKLLETDDGRWDVRTKELESVVRPLGFQRKRAERIWRMTEDFVDEQTYDGSFLHPDKVSQFYGVGKYAEDSYRMFVNPGEIPDYLVEDGKLSLYVEWARSRHG